jgi:flagellar export protein FliJ
LIESALKTLSPESKRSQGIAELKKFRFGLETVLRHREDLEQKEKDELFRRTYRYQMELRCREELTVKFQETMKDLSQKQSEHVANHELTCYYLYLNRLTLEMRESEKRLFQLQSEVQAQKEMVIEASKKRKTLATMREKKEKAYITIMEKREQQEIDDLVVTRYTTKEPRIPPNGRS